MPRPRAYITGEGHTEIEVIDLEKFCRELTRLFDGVFVEFIPDSETVKVHLSHQTYEVRQKERPAQASVIGVGVSDVDLIVAELDYSDQKKNVCPIAHGLLKELGDGNWVVGGFEVVGVPMHVIGPRPNAKKNHECCGGARSEDAAA